MPFTPIHLGPGIFVKGMMGSSFSLMVFGWSQIVMDLQPLFVMITGEGHLHGFSHTYLGALLISIFTAISGKYLSELGLLLLGLSKSDPIEILWWVSYLSALVGCLSHVFLDSIMHSDIAPFFPILSNNSLFGFISISTLHKVCLYSGLLGAAIYFFVIYREKILHC